MRAVNVIIITTGVSHLAREGVLDSLIEKLLRLKRNPVLVLGEDGDEVLRYCQHLEDCEVVFDPNYQGGLFSGIKSGLQATNGAAFALPLSTELPPDFLWDHLERQLFQSDVARSMDILEPALQGVENRPSFPVLITARGNKTLLTLAASTEWDSSELMQRQPVEVPSPSA